MTVAVQIPLFLLLLFYIYLYPPNSIRITGGNRVGLDFGRGFLLNVFAELKPTTTTITINNIKRILILIKFKWTEEHLPIGHLFVYLKKYKSIKEKIARNTKL